MGDELVSDSLAHITQGGEYEAAHFSYRELFDKYLPYYLSIGMSADEYWNGDCMLVKAYREAYKYKREMENQRLWLQGLYVYEAIYKLAPVLNPNTKKGTKLEQYSEEPYALTKEEIERRKERDAIRHQLDMRERIMAKTHKINNSLKENG